MDFLEKDLEEIVYKATSESLDKAGLKVRGRRFRQKKIGNYGIADMITLEILQTFIEEKYYRVTIYELKKDHVTMETFHQALRYAIGVLSYLKFKSNLKIVIDIVLIGRKIKEKSFVFLLPDLFNNSDPEFEVFNGIGSLKLYEYSYDIDGLKFNKIENGYRLANEGFKF